MYNHFTLKSLNSVCFTDLLQPWVLRMCTSVRFSLQEVSMMYTTLERDILKPICTLLITCWTGGAISRYSKKRITWLYFCFRNIRCIRYDLQYFLFLYRVVRRSGEYIWLLNFNFVRILWLEVLLGLFAFAQIMNCSTNIVLQKIGFAGNVTTPFYATLDKWTIAY